VAPSLICNHVQRMGKTIVFDKSVFGLDLTSNYLNSFANATSNYVI
jgi:hypothetical protein